LERGGDVVYSPLSGLSTASIYSAKWAAWMALCRKTHGAAFASVTERYRKEPEGTKKVVYYTNALANAISYKYSMEGINFHG
jgi:hypothetical protein